MKMRSRTKQWTHAQRLAGSMVCFDFVSIVYRPNLQLRARRVGVVPLLHRVDQLVCEQSLALRSAGAVLSCAEDDFLAHGICQSIDCFSRRCGLATSMYTHVAEVVSEARLKERTGGVIERLAGRAQHIMNNGRSHGGTMGRDGATLQFLFFALFTLSARTGRFPTRARTAQNGPSHSRHSLVVSCRNLFNHVHLLARFTLLSFAIWAQAPVYFRLGLEMERVQVKCSMTERQLWPSDISWTRVSTWLEQRMGHQFCWLPKA